GYHQEFLVVCLNSLIVSGTYLLPRRRIIKSKLHSSEQGDTVSFRLTYRIIVERKYLFSVRTDQSLLLLSADDEVAVSRMLYPVVKSLETFCRGRGVHGLPAGVLHLEKRLRITARNKSQ